MITNVLLDHPVLAWLTYLVGALICASVGYLLARRPAFGPRVAWVLSGVSMLPIGALTLVPTSRVVEQVCAVQFSVPSLAAVENVANIALFVPLALFATVAIRRPVVILAAGSGMSLMIEGMQALIPSIGRSCDTNDWLMNTIGVILGVLAALAVIALAKARNGTTGGPTVGREP